jgi:hypothetical protein
MPVFDVGRFLDKRSRNIRIGCCFSKLQKRRYLTHNVLTLCHSISPVSYFPPA